VRTENIIALAGVLINLGAISFLGLQIRLAVIGAKREWAQKRREATLRTFMGTIERRERYKAILPSDRDKVAINAMIAEAVADPIKDHAIRDYMNYYEMVATGVNAGVLDIEVIARFAGNSLINAWNNYLPWIVRERQRYQTDSLSCEFEQLAESVAPLSTNPPEILRAEDIP
jgi:hypothetical protein